MGFKVENRGTIEPLNVFRSAESKAEPQSEPQYRPQAGAESLLGELRQQGSQMREKIASTPTGQNYLPEWASPSTDSSASSTPEAERRRRLTEARAAQAKADALARSARGKNAGIRQEAEKAAADAQRKWDAVKKSIESELRSAARGEADPAAQSAAVARRAKELAAQTPGDARFVQTVKEAELNVVTETKAAAVSQAYQTGGPGAAARKLRELTANVSPEEAARIIAACRPTVEQIAADLGRSSAQGENAIPKGAFDQIVGDLTAACHRAAKSPGGRQAVAEVADSITRNVPAGSDAFNKFYSAFERAVGAGDGAELATEVTRQLQSAGRTTEAKFVFAGIRDGVRDLHDRVASVGEKVKKNNQELAWLVRNWGAMMTREQLQNAIAKYKSRHPEYAELDRLAGAALGTVDTLTNLPAGVKELDAENYVRKSAQYLLTDEKTQTAILQSPSARAELARMMKLSQAGEETLLDRLGDFPSSKAFRGNVLCALVDAAVKNAVEDRSSGRAEDAGRDVAQLKGYARQLGFDQTEVNQVVDQLGKCVAAKTVQEGKEAIEGLDRVINKLGGVLKEGGAGAESKQIEGSLRAAGLMLSIVGVAQSLQGAQSPQQVVETLCDAAGVGRDGAELVAGMFDREGLLNSAEFKLGSKVIDRVGVGLDLIRTVQSAAKGDAVEAGLYAASTAGGLIMLSGSAGPGALIVLAAAVGQYQHNRVKETNRHEASMNEEAKLFLIDGGVRNEAVAVELLNQDGEGESPGPLFADLAEHLDLTPSEFFGYLNKLTPGQTKALVRAAHDVMHRIRQRVPDKYSQQGYTADTGDLLDLLANHLRNDGYPPLPNTEAYDGGGRPATAR